MDEREEFEESWKTFEKVASKYAAFPLILVILGSIVLFLCQKYVNWWYAIVSAILLVLICGSSRFCRMVLAVLLGFEAVASGWFSISLWTEVPFMGKICTATTPLDVVLAIVVSGYALFAVLSFLGLVLFLLRCNSES